MARDWPAKDMVPLVELIADPRHRLQAMAPTASPRSRRARSSNCASQRLTALGRDEIGDELNKIGGEIKEYLAILALPRPHRRYRQGRAEGDQGRVRRRRAAPRSRDRRRGRRRRPDPARGYGRHRQPQGLHQARAAVHLSRPDGAAARAAPACRRATRISLPALRRQHPHAGAVLLLARHGYRMKVWRLPLAAPQAPGKALVNLLPLRQGETITSILPLPEDEATWAKLDVIFATLSGNVRRNTLSDFDRGQAKRQDRNEARSRATASWRSRSARATTCC